MIHQISFPLIPSSVYKLTLQTISKLFLSKHQEFPEGMKDREEKKKSRGKKVKAKPFKVSLSPETTTETTLTYFRVVNTHVVEVEFDGGLFLPCLLATVDCINTHLLHSLLTHSSLRDRYKSQVHSLNFHFFGICRDHICITVH
jgi:hypothetical protein